MTQSWALTGTFYWIPTIAKEIENLRNYKVWKNYVPRCGLMQVMDLAQTHTGVGTRDGFFVFLDDDAIFYGCKLQPDTVNISCGIPRHYDHLLAMN